MKICLVAAFPPSGGPLNEYSFHIAREIQRYPGVELTVLADELVEGGGISEGVQEAELPGFHVIRCWKFGSVGTPLRLLKAIRRIGPDVVWFNLVFSSFGTHENPLAAFAGLAVPALTRSAGYYTHVTLHHIVEHVDFAASGVRREKLYRLGTNVITRTLLKAHSVSVLLSTYRRTLIAKYDAENIVLGTHGVFTPLPSPPDFSKRGNPETRILAFGHWGTYKRLETLMEAFPVLLAKIPNARLIVGGGNHPTKPGYWESVRDAQDLALPIDFLGFVPQADVAELFRTSSLLVMPYDSSTGSSGPAHQACEYGLPIVCADIADFQCMATDGDMSISFYRVGDANDLVEKLTAILQSPKLERDMGTHNYWAGIQMTMASIARTYLRWFELQQLKRVFAEQRTFIGRRRRWMRHRWTRTGNPLPPAWKNDPAHPDSPRLGKPPSDLERPPELENA